MMFAKVMAAAVTIGALGGASLAVAQNVSAPGPAFAVHHEDRAPLAQQSNTACADVAFRIYFEPGSYRLNAEARETIAVAAHDVGPCGRVDVEVAADVSRIDTSEERRLSSQRSVAVLNEMRRRGVVGDVFVAPVRDVVVAAERDVSPDFVEVAIAPRSGGQLLSSVTGSPTDM